MKSCGAEEIAREIAEKLVDWQMATGKFLTASSGERAPVIPHHELVRILQAHALTEQREQPSILSPDYCQLTTSEVVEWLTVWIRSNTTHKRFTPNGANVSARTWAKASIAFSEFIADQAIASLPAPPKPVNQQPGETK